MQLSSFVGRASELSDLQQLLATERLVTLTGPGGCGKTRLALEVAARLGDRFEDGSRFISLAPLDDPGLVSPAVARALEIRDVPGRLASEALIAALAQRDVLLILDNFEHLLDAAALCAVWLAACPGLTILATSRERLRLQGERVYPVPPLGLADADGADPAASEAVRLFLERSRAIAPDLEPTDATAPVVAEICRRLDGLPLAIELAAARSGMLSPAAMLARLDRATGSSPFELLAGGARDLPPRQQTLRRTIAWSYELLDAAEQQLFRRLSIFVGGFTLEAVEAVCDAPLDAIGSLLERSLLRRADAGAGEPRFEMLVTIREFAREQLDLSGEGAVFRARHARYYRDVAEQIAPLLHGAAQARWLDALDVEHGNLRAAMTWAAAHDLELALDLGGALWRFWQVRGHVPEGRRWLDRVVAADAVRSPAHPTPSRAQALNAAAFLAFMAGDYDEATRRHRETLSIRRALGDREGIAESLNSLGLTLRSTGDHDAADPLFDEALLHSRALGNRAREANILNNQARAAYYRGQLAAAESRHELALAAARQAGDAWAIAICLGDLGDVHQARGDAEAARRLYAESLAAWQALGDLRGVAQALEGFAGLMVVAQPEAAVRLFGACAAIRESIGEPCSLVRRTQLEQTAARARATLGPERYAAASADGRGLSVDGAVDVALTWVAAAHSPPPATSGPSRGGWGPLTRRETEVARLVAEGQSNRQIAAALVLSERTVGTHLDHIFARLGVSSRTAVATYAVRNGLI